jgi:hypothetical protein
MRSQLDDICDLVSGIDLPEKEAEELYKRMEKFKSERSVSYKNLRSPGFAKLWDALEEAVQMATGHFMDETTVWGYFREKFGKEPRDATLVKLSIDSNCGKDCVKMIDQAVELLKTIDQAGVCAEERDAVIAAVDHGVQIFWRG